MKQYTYWTRARQPKELMCIECGAIRPTLHLPEFRCDPVTRTFGPLIAMSMAILAAQRPELFAKGTKATTPPE